MVRVIAFAPWRGGCRIDKAAAIWVRFQFGGHSLFIKDKKLYYVYNFLGIKPEQQFVSPELTPGKYTLGMEFTRESAGKYHESLGETKLYVDDKVVAEGPMKTQPGKFTLSGDGLCIGRDSGDAVSQEYQSPGEFEGLSFYEKSGHAYLAERFDGAVFIEKIGTNHKGVHHTSSGMASDTDDSPVHGLADDLQAGLQFQQDAQTFAHQALVVYEQEPDQLRHVGPPYWHLGH